MKFLRLLFVSLICWPVGLAVEAVFLVLGWIVVPVLAWRKCWTDDWAFDVHLHAWSPRWAFPWGDQESGIFGPVVGRNGNERRWCKKAALWSWRRRAISWCAFRNPASNLRFTRWGVYVNPWFVEWIGNSPNPARDFGGINMTWCWARQGWRSGLWIVRAGKDGRAITHRLGWAICPQPLREIDRHAGFKLQVYRRG